MQSNSRKQSAIIKLVLNEQILVSKKIFSQLNSLFATFQPFCSTAFLKSITHLKRDGFFFFFFFRYCKVENKRKPTFHTGRSLELGPGMNWLKH